MSNPATEATVRYATSEDVPAILSLIHELADYEKSTSSVLATEHSLRSTLSFPPFPSPGYARTLLLFAQPSHPGDNSTATSLPPIAGFALFFPNYSTWRAAPGIYLEDLFIRPAFRGRGYGKRLLGELARETRKIGGERLEWSVLKWNEPSIGFYNKLGAQRMEEWVEMRVEGNEMLENLSGLGRGVGGEKGEHEMEERVGVEKRGLDEEERAVGK